MATANGNANAVVLSTSDRAPQLQLDPSRLVATSRKGYRSVRATHGFTVGQDPLLAGGASGGEEGGPSSAPPAAAAGSAAAAGGAFYWEAEIAHLGATGHARLGWSTRASDVAGPVGYDAHGYGFRDVSGEGVHCGWRRALCGGLPFKEGDVVGLLLHAPPSASAAAVGRDGEASISAAAADAAAAAASAGRNGNDDDEDAEAAEAAATAHLPPAVPGAFIGYCVNGAWQGRAYEGRVRPGTYYPTVSLYTLPEQAEGASVRANFGPAFRFPPPTAEALGLAGVEVRPACDLAAVAAAAAAAAQAVKEEGEEDEEEVNDKEEEDGGEGATQMAEG